VTEYQVNHATAQRPVSDTPAAVDVRRLSVTYGPVTAVRDVSFSVAAGQIVGLIGPNGAGKTSIVESVGGLRDSTSGGSISVFGHDPLRERKAVSRLIGMQLQDSSFPSRTRVSELCELYEAIYDAPDTTAPLLEKFGIADRRNSLISTLSGGMRQRLALVLAQVGDVRLIILDELTTGLDPENRRETWESVLDLAHRGIAVLLTSHYMDEIEALCSYVGVLRKGQMIAFDTPARITAVYGGPAAFSVAIDRADPLFPRLLKLGLRELPGAFPGAGPGHVDFTGVFPEDYNSIVQAVVSAGMPASIVGYRSPTLEDAYLHLVRDGENGDNPQR